MTDPVVLSRTAISQFAAKRKPGYESALLSFAIASDERSVTITRADYNLLRDEFALLCGPGCQLRKTLSWWGISDDGSCGCNEMAARMDQWRDECWNHLEEIVEHLRHAAEKRGMPFVATAARIMVARAIDAARQEVVRGQEAQAKGRETDLGQPAG